mgnify:FL=1|jgi:hypothetical protein
MAGITIDSDYKDYYDNALREKDEGDIRFTLTRRKDERAERPRRFDFMSKLGLKTPLYGKIKELIPSLLERDKILTDCPGIEDVFEVVVYLPGEKNNKIRLTYRQAINRFPDNFGCEYIPSSPSGIGVSWEYICIGTSAFWLQRSSSNNWQANKGDTRIRLSNAKKKRLILEDTLLRDCLFSTTFIMLRNRMIAVNYHTSPIIKGTPIQRAISAKDASESIKNWYKLNNLNINNRVA